MSLRNSWLQPGQRRTRLGNGSMPSGLRSQTGHSKLLLKGAMLLMSVFLTACTGYQARPVERVQIVTVPQLPEPVTPPDPRPPNLDLPPVMVITAVEAEYFRETCEEFSELAESDTAARQALEARTEMTQGNACDWAIYGFTVQDWLTLEVKMAEIAGYVDQLRAQLQFLRELMKERQRVMDERAKALQSITSNEASD